MALLSLPGGGLSTLNPITKTGTVGANAQGNIKIPQPQYSVPRVDPVTGQTRGSITGNINPGNSPVGTRAASPVNNIKPPSPIITPQYQAKQATLYGPNGQKQVVTVGSGQASQLQSQGWTLTPSSTQTSTQPNVDSSGVITYVDGSSYNPKTGAVTNAPGAAPVLPRQSGQGVGINTQNTSQNVPTGQNQAPAAFSATTSGGSPNTGLMGELIATTANRAMQPSQAYLDAQKQVSDIQQKMANLINEYQQKIVNIEGTAGFLTQAGGEKALLQQQYDTAYGALANQLNQAQQQVTAANTQQQIEQQGLLGATQYLQPTLGAYGQAQYSPLGGIVGGGSGAGVSPADPFYATMQTYAQALANNQPTAIPSTISSNPVLQAQLIKMAQAINPNFNYNTAVGVGSAQQNVAQIGGSATVTGNQAVYNTALQQVAELEAKNANVKSFGNMVLQNMTSNNINPTASQWANKTLNEIKSQFSSPAYAQFNANIQGLQARVSDLLQTGEIPSAATAGASQIVNGNISLGAMQSTLNQLINEGDALVENKKAVAQNAYTNTTQGSTGGKIDWNTLLNYGQ